MRGSFCPLREKWHEDLTMRWQNCIMKRWRSGNSHREEQNCDSEGRQKLENQTKTKTAYLADYHVHSKGSPDGKCTICEMAAAAVAKGLQEICITDHWDTIYWDGRPRTTFDWVAELADLERARQETAGKLTIKLGAEMGEVTQSFDRAEILRRAAPPLDFVIGSVHTANAKYNWFDLYYLEPHDRAYYNDVIDGYLGEVEKLACWGKFSVLGHLSLPLRYLNETLHQNMSFDPWMDRVEEIFRIIIPAGIGIECNTNRGNDPLPGEQILRLYHDLGGEIITLGSDAHDTASVGCVIGERQELLRACGFTYFATFSAMKPEFHRL
jgi:histidinol-phosphatase (PHP family)